MGIIDDILRKNADDRLAEEMLYAEAIREIEQGVRRDGLWGKALADSEGDEKKAKGLYLKYRVQALKDELERERQVRIQEETERTNPNWAKEEIERRVSRHQTETKTPLYHVGKFIGKLFR